MQKVRGCQQRGEQTVLGA